MHPKVSVVIATYQPGARFDRVIASLDAQTLPQTEFETVVVDDGSPDDTVARLSALAATRPNMRVERIDNSGWPSRPRNVGIRLARGEWVLFMDHDDSLYPDALRRLVEYGAETHADVVSPKESKTSDAWWGMPALLDGNRSDASAAGVDALIPMVPHKLYRRDFLDRHGIRFPEGRRQLWEDIYVNVESWRHAERIAVLADTPVYLWHANRGNNSRTYGPRDTEFWDRLDDLFAFIDRTLDGPEHAEARLAALTHQYSNRVLTRYSRSLRQSTKREAAAGLERAQAIQERYWPEERDAQLGKHVRARSLLLRAGRSDLLEALWAVDSDTSADVRATSAAWGDGELRIGFTARWADRAGQQVMLRRHGDRLVRELPDAVLAALPPDVVDLSDTVDRVRVHLGVRDRLRHVTWSVPLTGSAGWEEDHDGRVAPVFSGEAVLDPRSLVFGGALEPHPHDLIGVLHWDAAMRVKAVRYEGRAAPALLAGRPAVAYRSLKSTLALDLGGTLRNPAADGGAANARIPAAHHRLSLALPRVHVAGAGRSAAAIRLTPAPGTGRDTVLIEGILTADSVGARIDADLPGRIPHGLYEIAFRFGDGPFLGNRSARVHAGAITLLTRAAAQQPPVPPVRRVLDGVRRRLRR